MWGNPSWPPWFKSQTFPSRKHKLNTICLFIFRMMAENRQLVSQNKSRGRNRGQFQWDRIAWVVFCSLHFDWIAFGIKFFPFYLVWIQTLTIETSGFGEDDIDALMEMAQKTIDFGEWKQLTACVVGMIGVASGNFKIWLEPFEGDCRTCVGAVMSMVWTLLLVF